MNGLHGILLFLAAVAIFVGVQQAIDSTNPCSAFSQRGHCESQNYSGE